MRQISETKRYLSQIYNLNCRIENKKSERDQLRELATSVACFSNTERVQTSVNQDKIGDTVTKIVDLEAEITATIVEYLSKKEEIIKTIESVENANMYNLLYKRYVGGKTLTIIADEMGFSEDYIKHLHGDALNTVRKIKHFES
jgi:DNA-directed RNA polymerase specialized sigma subunit